MKSQTKLERMVHRLLISNWAPDYSQTKYHIQLVREYHRRVALWTKALDCTQVGDWPFFDIAYKIDPTVRADDSSIEKVMQHLREINHIHEPARRIYIWALHWSALADTHPEKIENFNLLDPYEPIITAYEKGFTLNYQHALL